MTEADAAEKSEAEMQVSQQMFMQQLGVDEEIATILVQEGFSTIEEVAYVPDKEIVDIEEFDETLVDELRSRARDILLTKAIASEQQLGDSRPADDLLGMQGMNEDLAYVLASRGIETMEDLAEQSVDELMEVDGMDEQRAGELILTARAPWFEAAAAKTAAAENAAAGDTNG